MDFTEEVQFYFTINRPTIIYENGAFTVLMSQGTTPFKDGVYFRWIVNGIHTGKKKAGCYAVRNSHVYNRV